MADSSTTLVLEHTDVISGVDAGAKRRGVMALVNYLQGALAGAKRGVQLDVFPNGADPVAASGTLTLATCTAGTVVEVNGVDFVAVNGTATSGNNEFDISGGTDTLDAVELAAAINASTSTGIQYVVSATSALGVVTVTALQKGALANGLTLKTGGIRANGTVTYVTPSGAQTVVVNGVTVYNATAGATATLTAAAAAAAINASTDALISGHVKALSRAGVLYIYAAYDGAKGNAITTEATGTGATADQARLAGGTEASSAGAQATGTFTLTGVANGETLAINGVTITAHTNTDANNQFRIDGDDTADAVALARAINTSTTALVQQVIATSSSNIVTVTARRGGISGNTIAITSGQASIVVSGDRLTTGAVPTTVVPSGARLGSGAGGAVTKVSYTL